VDKSAMDIKREQDMYGCTEEELRAGVENCITFKLSGAEMMTVSVLSDAQELIDMDRKEEARQYINRAKWVIINYLHSKEAVKEPSKSDPFAEFKIGDTVEWKPTSEDFTMRGQVTDKTDKHLFVHWDDNIKSKYPPSSPELKKIKVIQ
jgi:hypothetical protein